MSAHRYTMAQMKNKTNETKNVHTELCKCNHASQWVYVGKTWVYTVVHTVHSVIRGHDKSAPYSGCTWV